MRQFEATNGKTLIHFLLKFPWGRAPGSIGDLFLNNIISSLTFCLVQITKEGECLEKSIFKEIDIFAVLWMQPSKLIPWFLTGLWTNKIVSYSV